MMFNQSGYHLTLSQPLYVVTISGLAYSLIFLTAIVGNIMVLVVVSRTPRMHSVTNFFIVNLALADILVASLCIPLTFLDYIFLGWPFGSLLCKVTPYVQGVSVNVTAYLLVFIAVDRFLAICLNPHKRITKKGAIIIICLVWMISLALMVPWAVFYEKYDSNEVETPWRIVPLCSELWSSYDWQRVFHVVVIFLGTYVIPLCFIVVFYTLIACRVCHRQTPGLAGGREMIRRSKVNVLKMLITVVLMFALSWLPLHAIYMIAYFHPMDSINDMFRLGMPIAQWLGNSNSGMNAFIYSYYSQNFRQGFKHFWKCLLFKRKTPRGHVKATQVNRNTYALSTSLTVYQKTRTTDINDSCRSSFKPLNRASLATGSMSSSSSGKEQVFI